LHLAAIHGDTGFRDHMPQVCHLCLAEGALGELEE
jgi:hypothetical protein